MSDSMSQDRIQQHNSQAYQGLSPEALAEGESRISASSLEELDVELPDLCHRVQRHIDSLSQWFVDRRETIEIAMLCAVLGEPLLLIGPPGTAKSLLCTRFAESLHLGPQQRFDYLLTPFTEPSELFGPVDLHALREGRFIRRHHGMITHVKVAFLDEIFRANSAILNALLALLNERKYYEEGQAKPSPLSIIFAASNDFPNERHLNALSDRFVLKVPVHNVHQHRWSELIKCGLTSEAYVAEGSKPWSAGPASYLDLLKIRRYLQLSLMHESRDPSLSAHFFPAEVMAQWRQLLTTFELDLGLYVSDRKVIRLYRILRAQALIRGRSSVQMEDLKILKFLAQRPGEHELISERLERVLALK